MTKAFISEAEREQRLNDILLAYVEAVEAGHVPDRRQLLALYPEFASELSDFFEGRDRIEVLSGPLRDFSRSGMIRAALEITKEADPKTSETTKSSADVASPAAPAIPPSGSAPELGQLGDYRLIREVGRGGMGIVYEAHQISLNRRVALKVLPFAAALDPKQLQRFKNEAQAAAQLHHNFIVPVYAVGYERGIHYYAMQFIEGQSLATMIRELRQMESFRQPTPASKESRAAASHDELPSTGPYTSDSPSPPPVQAEHPTLQATALSTERSLRSVRFYRRVAELGVRAAEALDHAHQEGVVHRDIKPANLLVDVRGNLWITDFGLALFHSDAGLTMTGELLGTLRYMSPEQALGKRTLVDHRTDIYSLGVTLYELLTLNPVFDGHDRQELLNQIANDEPKSPRSLDKSIPVELETIILKAIAKHPTERYASIREMGDDLQRFIEDKPILARRPSFREKAMRWSRRHKPIVVSAGLLLFLTFIGSVVLTVSIAEEHAKTKKALERETESFRQARQAVDFFAELGQEKFGENADPTKVRRELLERALNYYQNFIEQRGDDPSLQAELAASYAKVANLLGDLGADLEALSASQRARTMYEKLISEHPSVQEFQDALAAIRQRAFNWQGVGPLFLLTQRPVQEDLKLTDEQISKIRDLKRQVDSQREEFGGFWPGKVPSQEEKERYLATFRKQAKDNREAIAAILDPAQKTRMKQIGWQLGRHWTFSDPEVIAKLELTTNQIDQIREIQDQARNEERQCHKESWDARKAAKDEANKADRDSGRKRIPEIWRTAQARIMSTLSPAQTARWREMVGEPFKGEMMFPPPPPHQRGRRTADWTAPGKEKPPPQRN
jgi:serine/threonine protein kinase